MAKAQAVHVTSKGLDLDESLAASRGVILRFSGPGVWNASVGCTCPLLRLGCRWGRGRHRHFVAQMRYVLYRNMFGPANG